MGVIIFNGRPSNDYGIVVEEPPGHVHPERDIELVHVPGRNGDVIFDDGAYKNVTLEYKIAMGSRNAVFYELSNALVSWLHPAMGYKRLEDTYDPEVYRLACYRETYNLENVLFHAGRATISFDAKPQRFLKLGESKETFSSNGSIFNPTVFTSLPLIKITIAGNQSGVLTIEGYTVTISAESSSAERYIYLDCDLQDVYNDTKVNKSSVITLSYVGFPRLGPGKNSISFSGGIREVEVTPRWWML